MMEDYEEADHKEEYKDVRKVDKEVAAADKVDKVVETVAVAGSEGWQNLGIHMLLSLAQHPGD